MNKWIRKKGKLEREQKEKEEASRALDTALDEYIQKSSDIIEFKEYLELESIFYVENKLPAFAPPLVSYRSVYYMIVGGSTVQVASKYDLNPNITFLFTTFNTSNFELEHETLDEALEYFQAEIIKNYKPL